MAPTSGDDAAINNGGTAQLPTGDAGAAATVSVGYDANGTMEISGGTLSTTTGYVGEGAAAIGRVTVSGGSWTNTMELAIGRWGTGTLTVSGGTVGNGTAYLGVFANSSGTATVSGGSWTNTGNVEVGYLGEGTLEVSGGTVSSANTFVGDGAAGIGTVTVSSGELTATTGLAVGRGGTGELTLSGGTVSSENSYLGVFVGSSGTATVTDGTWTNTQGLTVGYFGEGTLEISGGTVSATNGVLGLTVGGTGEATVSGGTWTNSAATIVGESGTGTLTISGGTVSDTDGYLGLNAGATGTATVSAGSWTNTGGLNVGLSGTGTLTISGGSVSTQNGVLGFSATGSGTATVSGGTWTNSAATIVGQSGSGTLNMSGGTISDTTGYLGLFAGSTGTATLTGGTWESSSALVIGSLGTGTVTVAGISTLDVGAGAGTITLAQSAGSQGSLIIGQGAAPGAVNAAAVQGGSGLASLTFNHNSGAYFFNPSISGNVKVQQTGSGTTVFTQDKTYSGNTVIQNGTLAARNLVNSTVQLTPNGRFSPGNIGIVATSHVGGLTLDGGTLVFDLSAGGLSDQILSASAVSLNAPISFFFNDAGYTPGSLYTLIGNVSPGFDLGLLSYSSNISGLAGAFRLVGDSLVFGIPESGHLDNQAGTPTGSSFLVVPGSFTGPAGASNTVGGLTFTPIGTLVLNGPLAVSEGLFDVPTGAGTILGNAPLSTPGNFLKTGQGLLNLLVDVIVGGDATVTQGGLSVNRNFTVNNLIVQMNAYLQGGGVISGDVFNSGVVSPGNSPGTLTIDGDFTQTASGALDIEIASASLLDQLIISGNASLAGTLNVIPYGGLQLQYGQQFQFLQAGSISGSFDSIVTPAGFRGRILEEDSALTLLIAPQSYTQVAVTGNQRNVAAALDSYITASGNDRETVSTALDLQSASEYPDAFDAISPAYYETLTAITIEQAVAQSQMIAQRLSAVRLGARGFQAIGIEAPLVNDKDGKSVLDAKDAKNGKDVITATADSKWGVWAQGNGIFSKYTSLNQLPNYRYQNGGFFVGVDYGWSEHFATGLFGGYQGTYAKYSNGSMASVNSALFGGYATYQNGGFYSDAIISGGYNGYVSKRSVAFSTIDRTARANPNGGQLTSYLDFGYDWKVSGFTFGPLISAQYTYSGVAPFTETGADSLDLRVEQQNTNSLRTNLGGRVAYTWNLTDKITIIPEVRMFWQHEYLQNSTALGASLDGGAGPGFDYMTTVPGRDSVFAGAGLSANFSKDFSVYLNYNTSFGRQDYISQMVSTGLNWKF